LLATLLVVFTERKRESVRAAFALCGYFGTLRTLPLDWGDEICFILGGDDAERLIETHDVHDLELVLQGVLDRKVWVLADIGNPTVPFA
jgi:hypothetical protein